MSNTAILEKRLQLFPISTRILGQEQSSALSIDGQNLAELAEQFGAPLYLYDRATLDQAVERYRAALRQYYPGSAGITYAGKAYLCLAIAQWTQQQNLWLDCTGAGELAIAAAARTPRSNVLVHGVNKSQEDLQAALAHAGVIVVDNLTELERLAELYPHASGELPNLWLRLRPGVAVETHRHIQTGQEDSKFGMSAAEVMQAVEICQSRNLPLSGLHFHQGSHFHDPAPVAPALETLLDLIEETRASCNWTPQVVSPGGGWGVPYHEDDLPHLPVEEYVRLVAGRLAQGCQARGLPLPRLQLEPGRSLAAQAGVAIYRVGSVKRTAHRRWLLLDGGLADNPRPALYAARYSALPVSQPERSLAGPAWLAGPYCESGDILISDLPMPDIEPGEWVAIPVSGAYHLSMGSNYNGARKPAVLWLQGGRAHLIQRREVVEDLLRRDLALPPGD